jgi:hypothetical protein
MDSPFNAYPYGSIINITIIPQGGRARAAAMGLRSGALGFGAISVAGAIVAVADHALDFAGVKADSNVGYFARIIAGLPFAFIPFT